MKYMVIAKSDDTVELREYSCDDGYKPINDAVRGDYQTIAYKRPLKISVNGTDTILLVDVFCNDNFLNTNDNGCDKVNLFGTSIYGNLIYGDIVILSYFFNTDECEPDDDGFEKDDADALADFIKTFMAGIDTAGEHKKHDNNKPASNIQVLNKEEMLEFFSRLSKF